MDSWVYKLSLILFSMILCTQMRICLSDSNGFISWGDLGVWGRMNGKNDASERVIVVSKDGDGESRTVQGAVDLIPHGNTQRVKIMVHAGFYREKVVVPLTKPFVSFIGNGSSQTIISWNSRASDKNFNGQYLGTLSSATVAIESDYFCAREITFENTSPSALPGVEGMQAVALRVTGDKAMFFRCRFLGSQDTLFDHRGRHYFLKCFIQGSIDFIFGRAKSLYQDCTLHSIASSFGAVAASQRNSEREDSGFSFLNCTLNGSGLLYLGRAWGAYASIVYSFCHLEDIINTQRWNDWGDPSRRGTVMFGEYMCSGKGAELKARVPWGKSLTYQEAKPFLDKSFINGDEWLRL